MGPPFEFFPRAGWAPRAGQPRLRPDLNSNLPGANSYAFPCPVANIDSNADTNRDTISHDYSDRVADSVRDTKSSTNPSDQYPRDAGVRLKGIPGPGWCCGR